MRQPGAIPFIFIVLFALLACTTTANLPSGSGHALPTNTPTVTITITATRQSNLVAVNAERALNVRENKYVTSQVLVTLLTGTPVEVTGACSDGWVPVRFEPINSIGAGWVNARYLTGDVCH